MPDVLRPILELLVVIPGMLLAYLPVKTHLKQRSLALAAWLLPLFIVLCISGGLFCYTFHLPTAWVMPAVAILAILIYSGTLRVSPLKSLSVALAVCAVFSCVNSLTRAFDAILVAEPELWFCATAGAFYHLACWIFILLAWYPATHAARMLLEDENMAQTWYIFWTLPLMFIALNLFIGSSYKDTLYQDHITQGYIVISLALLCILALFYALFLGIANSLNRNAKLQQENDFLAMQQSRYDNLRTAIEETRHARHDLHHHFNHLSALAEAAEWEKLKQYLADAAGTIPMLDMRFSENRAADSVIGHYRALAGRENIPFSARIDLPETLPVDEMDLCLVLSNLLENALEASLRTDSAQRWLQVTAYQQGTHFLLISVENAFSGELRQKNGVFQSSKRKGAGIGLQSVRRVAEKNGGDCSFSGSNGVFTAKVMLRGDPGQTVFPT